MRTIFNVPCIFVRTSYGLCISGSFIIALEPNANVNKLAARSAGRDTVFSLLSFLYGSCLKIYTTTYKGQRAADLLLPSVGLMLTYPDHTSSARRITAFMGHS